MHEELFLTSDTYATEHPRIICAREPRVGPEPLMAELEDLHSAIARNDEVSVRKRLFSIVGDAASHA